MKVSPLGCWARRAPGKRPLPRRHPAENGGGGAPHGRAQTPPRPRTRSQPAPATPSRGAGGAPGTCGVLWLSPPWRCRRCCGSWAAEPGSPRWPGRTAPPSSWTRPPPRRCTGPAGRASCWRPGRWLSARCPPRRRCRPGRPAPCSWWAGLCGAARRPRCAACWSGAPCGTACCCAATRRTAAGRPSWRRPCGGGWARAAAPRWCCGARRSWRPSRRSSACCRPWQRSSRRYPAPAAPAPQRSVWVRCPPSCGRLCGPWWVSSTLSSPPWACGRRASLWGPLAGWSPLSWQATPQPETGEEQPPTRHLSSSWTGRWTSLVRNPQLVWAVIL